MSNPNQRNWRNFLINPRYQMKYVFWTSFTGMSLIAINAAVFYYFVKENYTILVDMSPMEDNVKAQLYRELYQILFCLGAFALLFVVATGLFGVVLSHRTAGPMYHFKRVFSDIRGGNRNARVRLRPRDDFQDVAKACNDMLDSIFKP